MPTSPSSTYVYSSSLAWACIGAASVCGPIGCSTSEKPAVCASRWAPKPPMSTDFSVAGAWVIVISILLNAAVLRKYTAGARLSSSVVHSCSPMSRKYEQKARAAAQEETRRRITEATVELHRTVGPARTTISAIAEKAGVQRLTVYRHFPEGRELFAACSAHWLAADPPPDPAGWTDIAPALEELYAWYRRNADMLANTSRDAPSMPVLAEIADPTPFLGAAHRTLMRGRPRRKRIRAALAHALEFGTWRSLAGLGLSDAECAALMADFVAGA